MRLRKGPKKKKKTGTKAKKIKKKKKKKKKGQKIVISHLRNQERGVNCFTV